MQGTIDGIHAIWPNTHTFPRAGEQFNNAASPEYWNPAVPRPTCATNPYEMWIDQTNDVISLRSHFDCCGWAVDFWPRGRDTCVNLYAQVRTNVRNIIPLSPNYTEAARPFTAPFLNGSVYFVREYPILNITSVKKRYRKRWRGLSVFCA